MKIQIRSALPDNSGDKLSENSVCAKFAQTAIVRSIDRSPKKTSVRTKAG